MNIKDLEKDTVIKVEDLSKKFTKSLKRSMYYGSIDMARSMLGMQYDSEILRKGEFWALKDISFEVKKGETLGILGLNGSGKSTLLRVLSGIFPPDKGKITINGKVGSLIAVGAGFHPHMSGRENIYLNGVILGMTKNEIKNKFESIVQFAEIDEFLDAPVSTYSSGMRVRLGFAIAIHCEPDILLVDEILSVGDISFRNKSLRYMAEYRNKAQAILFVSHDIEQVRSLCQKAILIDRGQVLHYGDTVETIVKFEELAREERLKQLKRENESHSRDFKIHFDSDYVRFLKIGVEDKNGDETEVLDHKGSLKVVIDFEVKEKLEGLSINLPIVRDDNLDVYCINAFSDLNIKLENIVAGKYRASLYMEKHNLNPGVYTFGTLTFRNSKTFETLAKIKANYVFKVKSNSKVMEKGFIDVDQKWDFIKQ